MPAIGNYDWIPVSSNLPAAIYPTGDCDPVADPFSIGPGTSAGSGAVTQEFLTGRDDVPTQKPAGLPKVVPYGSSTGNNPGEFSEGPVRYFDGVVKLSSTDIVSDGFGTPFAQTRSWSNDPGYSDAANGAGGNGWVDSAFPALAKISPSTLAAVSNGTTARYFDSPDDTIYIERYSGQDVLSHDTAHYQYVLTTPAGETFRFWDFSGSTPTNKQGRFISRTDPYGNVTEVDDATRDSSGRPEYVFRGGSIDGQSVSEVWQYTYSGDYLSSVKLERGPVNGSLTTIREVDYTYYGTGDSNGNDGDLKTATLKDGAGNALGTDYYRYYTGDTYDANNNYIGYKHGLKYFLSAASFDRASIDPTTGLPVDPLTLSDPALAAYADNHFQYDSLQRVIAEDVQGQGCSACSSGLGHYTFAYTVNTTNPVDYNSWKVETVEGLPDGNQNIVFTNAYGEEMLFAYKDTGTNQQWINFYQYDSSGRVTLAAAPSAVTGYDPRYADLLNWTDGAAGGAERAVNQTTTGNQTAPVVAANAAGDSVAVWVGPDADGTGIFARRMNSDGTPAGNEFQVNTVTTGNQHQPAVAVAPDGSFIITWATSDGWGDGIVARRYAADGTAVDSTEFAVNTTWVGSQSNPQVGYAANGSFVIAWDDSYNGRCAAQRYAADGTAQGGELSLSNASTDSHTATRLAVAADGSFAVAWVATDFSTYMDLVVRKFAADGTATTGELTAYTVPTYGTTWISADGLALATNGSLLATWETADSWGTGIFGRVFDASATAGTSFLIPNHTVGDQTYESSAGLPDGGWVVAWQSQYFDSDGIGIVGRRLAADGTPTGDDFAVNLTTAGDQQAVSVAAVPGGFTAAWTGPDADGTGVFFRQFGAGYEYLNDTSGLITTYDYYTTTTATSTTAGGVAGLSKGESIQQGETGTPVRQYDLAYYHVTATTTGAPFNPLATSTVYRNDDGTGAETTTYAYTFYSGTGQVQTTTVSFPSIGASQNGSGTADTETGIADQYGRLIWSRDAGGFINNYAYDAATGALASETDDVDTSLPGPLIYPSGWGTPTGGGLNLETTYQVDGLGRVTEVTSRGGNVTYQVYDDANHEVRVYTGWNSTTHTATGPTTVIRDDRVHGYTETLTMSATPTYDSLTNAPTGQEAIGNLQTLSRSIVNAAGQTVASDDYFNLSGLTYSTSARLGTAGTNYYETVYGYDHRGWLNRTVSPTGTITREVHDGLGRTVSTWVGTNDTPTNGYWSPTNLAGTNMVEVSEDQYDGGGVGDSNLTQVTEHPDDSTADRVSQNFYDWRDRLVATKGGVQASESDGTHRPIFYTQYDNLGEPIYEERYDGDGVTITSTGGVPNRPSSTLRTVRTHIVYDDQGRVYQSDVQADPTSDDPSSPALHTDTWYDSRGNVIKVAAPGGAVTKSVYDGVGRPTVVYTTDGGGDPAPGPTDSWTAAGNVDGDVVFDQIETAYDADGNVILTTDRQRFHDATATGALGDPNSSTQAKARVYYTAYYYDAADRPTATVDVGTNGGTAYTRPSSVPARSDTVLVNSTSYNDAGWVSSTIDPAGIETRTSYDNLGRTTQTIENYVDGTPSNEDDKTTQFTYDGDDHTLTYKLVLPGGGQQTTQYNYGVSTSAIASNDLLASVYHPDPSTGTASSSQADTYSYNALGETTGFTDRNGTAHAYSFDVLGRPTADAVTLASGSTVDNSVLRLTTAYDSQGNPYLLTSYNATSGGSIVNQVDRQYNGLGQLTAEYQAHGGAVDTGSTPATQYTYTAVTGTANHSWLSTITYPAGSDSVGYRYDSIGRVYEVLSGDYQELISYLGLGTVVQRYLFTPNVTQTYIGSGTGDGGDQYVGLDRFGRIVGQRWVEGTTDLVNDAYGYDRDGNRLYQKDLVNSAMSELYGYDRLNQLTSFERGTLNSTNDAITGTASRTQDWSPDAAGNFSSVTSDGTAVSRTTNAQNEVTAIGSNTLTYDADGNTTTDDQGHTLVYDPWNRLVDVKSGSTLIAGYAYDALSRRISEVHGSTTTNLYLSAGDQVLDEVSGSAVTATLWDPTSVDAPLARLYGPGQSSTGWLYALGDANGDVVAVVAAADGSVAERYAYDPYGQVTYLTGTYGSESASAFGWEYLHQGLRFDSVVDLYDNRARAYSPTLMRFLQNDPMGFQAGNQNLYGYEGDSPTDSFDPSGMQAAPNPNNRPPEAVIHALELEYIRQMMRDSMDASGLRVVYEASLGWIADTAAGYAHVTYPGAYQEDQRNAFQHCVWQALILIAHSEDLAEAIGDAHEKYSPPKEKDDSTTDLMNNVIGRRIGNIALQHIMAAYGIDADTVRQRLNNPMATGFRRAVINEVCQQCKEAVRRGEGIANGLTTSGGSLALIVHPFRDPRFLPNHPLHNQFDPLPHYDPRTHRRCRFGND